MAPPRNPHGTERQPGPPRKRPRQVIDDDDDDDVEEQPPRRPQAQTREPVLSPFAGGGSFTPRHNGSSNAGLTSSPISSPVRQHREAEYPPRLHHATQPMPPPPSHSLTGGGNGSHVMRGNGIPLPAPTPLFRGQLQQHDRQWAMLTGSGVPRNRDISVPSSTPAPSSPGLSPEPEIIPSPAAATHASQTHASQVSRRASPALSVGSSDPAPSSVPRHGSQRGPGPQRGPRPTGTQGFPPRAPGTIGGASSVVDLEAQDGWMAGRSMTIVVGQEQKRYSVHVELLCSKSPYFRQKLLPEDEDEATVQHDFGELVLEEHDPKLFSMMVRWLYGTAFANTGGNGIPIFRFPMPDGQEVKVRDYLELYVYAHQVEMVGLRNAAVDVIYNHFGDGKQAGTKCPDLRDVEYIFDAMNNSESHMCRLLVVYVNFYLFSKKRQNSRPPLPVDWATVLERNGRIGWSMISMMADWKWVMGSNAPRMTIKHRHDFHEPMPFDGKLVKPEPETISL